MIRKFYKRKSTIKAGDKYNRLTAVKFIKRDKNFHQFWLFQCECGKKKVINISKVKKGLTKSCGCLHDEGNNFKHGMNGIKTHISWKSMKNRCLNPNATGYKDYGGRGIKICDEWLNNFINFFKDMGERPNGKTLDRKNNDGNYCKSNCRWADKFEQANNKRNNRR